MSEPTTDTCKECAKHDVTATVHLKDGTTYTGTHYLVSSAQVVAIGSPKGPHTNDAWQYESACTVLVYPLAEVAHLRVERVPKAEARIEREVGQYL